MGPYPRDTESLANQLRAAIHDSGLTCYKLGKETGVDHRHIDRFTSWDRDLTLEIADKLARYLGLELAKRRTRRGGKPRGGKAPSRPS